MAKRRRGTMTGWAGWLAMVGAMLAVMGGLPGDVEAYETSWGQGESEGDDLVVSLATFSPGDEVAQWFGHTALVVEDRRHNESRMYNFGMFTLDDEALLKHFAMGRLWFWVAATPVQGTIRQYIEEDRDVRFVELNLPPDRRLGLAEALADNVRPENRDYLYHHYDDNCSTRIRDLIDEAVDGQFEETYTQTPGRLTLREHTRRHSVHLPPMDWLLMFLMNGSIDHPITVWEEMFLPEELERAVLDFSWVDDEGEERALSLREHELYRAEDREPVPEEANRHWHWWLLLGLGLGAMGVVIGMVGRRGPGRRRRIGYGLYHLGVGLMLGLPGLVLGTMAVITDHDVTYWNQNLFWANPLTLLVVVAAVMVMRGSVRGRRLLLWLWCVLATIAALGLVVQIGGLWWPVLVQDTSKVLALQGPMIAGALASALLIDGRLIRRKSGGEGELDAKG